MLWINQRKVTTIPLSSATISQSSSHLAVLRDLSTVLLDSRFLDQLIETERKTAKPLTVPQLRLLLSDIACCSLMRLDPVSMDKLWDLMVVIFKWQLFVAKKDPHRLINLTFKHLDGIAKMMPEMKKGILVDMVKMKILTLWDTCDDGEKAEVASAVSNWVHPFKVKISILMRLGLQDDSCNFMPIDLTNRTHSDLLANIGENIYKKHPKSNDEGGAAGGAQGGPGAGKSVEKPLDYDHREFDELADQLQITPLDRSNKSTSGVYDTVISILDTLNIGGGGGDEEKERQVQSSHEFVQIRGSNSREEFIVDPVRVAEQPDLVELMKIPPHIPKY